MLIMVMGTSRTGKDFFPFTKLEYYSVIQYASSQNIKMISGKLPNYFQGSILSESEYYYGRSLTTSINKGGVSSGIENFLFCKKSIFLYCENFPNLYSLLINIYTLGDMALYAMCENLTASAKQANDLKFSILQHLLSGVGIWLL